MTAELRAAAVWLTGRLRLAASMLSKEDRDQLRARDVMEDAARTLAALAAPDPAPAENPLNGTGVAPTHRCKVCGALWVQWPTDLSWSLCTRTCGKCCDNAVMGEQIEKLPDPAPADALRELRDWLMYVYVYEPGIDHHPVLNDVADKLDELLARAATPAAADRSADDASRWDEERNQPCPKHGGGNCDC